VRRLAGLLVAVALVACAPSASGAPVASATPGASAAAGADQSTCRDLDLRSPSGEQLDLGGTWLGNDDAYWLFTQVGDCVWATATDHYGSDPLYGEDIYLQEYLRGYVQTDFTLPIEFAYSPIGNRVGPRYGHAMFQIEFGAGGDAEALTLRKVGGCTASGDPPCSDGEASFQVTLLTRVDSSVTLPAPSPRP